MRPQSLPRLIRVNQTVCLRLLQRRNLTGEPSQSAEQNYNLNTTSTNPRHIAANSQRDVHASDPKTSPTRLSASALSALHARIGLSSSFPMQTLTRCLTDPSMEGNHSLHNEALSVIGTGLLEYYVSEYLCVRWPRLPMKTQLAALWAFTGESALARIAREWGVQSEGATNHREKQDFPRYDGSVAVHVNIPKTEAEKLAHETGLNMEWEIREQERLGWIEPRRKNRRKGVLSTTEKNEYEKLFKLFALQRFVQSVVGGIYVHMGINATQNFIKAHILSRTLPPLSTMHIPTEPAREVTSLCERLRIPLPISRLIAESARYSNAAVFVVGVYSGREKLGEGQGQSIKEAKARANINALRAWYLYEQAGWEFAVPSRTEDPEKTYVMGYVDPGSIVL